MVTKCRKSVNLTLDQVQMDFKQDRIVDFLDFTHAAYLGWIPWIFIFLIRGILDQKHEIHN